MFTHMDYLMGCVDFLKELGYDVVYVALYGSQNYDMDTEKSDHDFKAVVMPTLRDLAMAKSPVSKTLEYGDGLVDVKDIRCMVDCWKKQNPNFMELLYTQWYWVSPDYPEFLWFREWRDSITHADDWRALSAMLGMMKEKRAALCKDLPCQHDVIEKYGYAAKQLVHCLRLRIMMEKFLYHPYQECLMAESALWLKSIKCYLTYFSPEQAQLLADEAVSCAEALKEEVTKSHVFERNDHILEQMDEMKVRLLEAALRKELSKK